MARMTSMEPLEHSFEKALEQVSKPDKTILWFASGSWLYDYNNSDSAIGRRYKYKKAHEDK